MYVCVCVCMHQIFQSGSNRSCECGCRQLNAGLKKAQQMLLTVEPSCWPLPSGRLCSPSESLLKVAGDRYRRVKWTCQRYTVLWWYFSIRNKQQQLIPSVFRVRLLLMSFKNVYSIRSCVCVFASVHICVQVSWEAGKVLYTLELKIQKAVSCMMCVCTCACVCACWEQKSDLLNEQQVLVVAETFVYGLCTYIACMLTGRAYTCSEFFHGKMESGKLTS